jgi:hypothetical protein
MDRCEPPTTTASSITIISKLRANFNQRTMAAMPAPVLGPAGGAPPLGTAPQLPYGADPGSITGWLLDISLAETPGTISRNDVVRVTTVHSIAQYSAGFGGNNTLHGRTVAILGEMMGDQLPMMIQFDPAEDEDLAHALALEAVMVPNDALVDAYFATPTADSLMPQTTLAQGSVGMNLPNFCAIPLAWAPYFLDFKTPNDAL